MIRRLKAVAGGRLRIWQITHRRQFWREAVLAATVLGFMGAMSSSYRSTIESLRANGASAEAEIKRLRGMGPLPPVTFVIEARSLEELKVKLAGIADFADKERFLLGRNIK